MVAASMIAVGGFIAVISIYARDQIGAGSRSMGLLVSTIGLGTIAGAFVVVHMGKRWDKTGSILAGLLAMAASLWLLGAAHETLPAFAGAFLLGAAAAAIVVPAQAYVQEHTPRVLLGRVQSSAVAGMGMAQMGSMALAGPLARLLGLPRFLTSLAGLLFAAVLVSAAGAAHLRRRRDLERDSRT
jgi:MFS family permease